MNPLLLAERAVLGAVLLEPRQLERLGWLRPEDFERPAHAALFAAFRHLADIGHPALDQTDRPTPLSWVNDSLDAASRKVRGLSPAYLHALAGYCPRSDHAPVYGRMVLDGAIRRHVLQHARRLHQTARAAALVGDPSEALQQTNVLVGTLDDLARRWGITRRPASPSRAVPVVPVPAELTEGVEEDERLLLARLADHPTSYEEVSPWLISEDFAVPLHGSLYRCLGALIHRAEPVDGLTLLWEAQRRGLLDEPGVTEYVAAVCSEPGAASAEWLGERVLRASLIRTTAQVARSIQELVDDSRHSPGHLIGLTLTALAPAEHIRSRWHAATGHARQPNGPPSLSTTGVTRANGALARSRLGSHRPHRAPTRPTSPTADSEDRTRRLTR
ncbi:DnaB-like helicase N-terminal domain-containing protein [Streptomyces sp. NPDC002896]|uniref:DnaB-like helicase N-terminal domain-containing protein n=1 Tax=Streptomyces sp. NPDC002896 TaxID=3154438 RepID=UPI00333440FC